MSNDKTQSSADPKDVDPKENGEALANKENGENSQKEASIDELRSKMLGGQPVVESDQDNQLDDKPAPEKDDEPDDPGEESDTKEETEDESFDSKEDLEKGSLEEFFQDKDESLSFKKTDKHPDIQDGDLDLTDGKYTIQSQNLYDEVKDIFGLEGTQPKIKNFFNINNNKPKKADAIAKLSGFKNRHDLAGAIEEFAAAESKEDKNAVLLEYFPEWTYYEDVEVPFSVNITKEEAHSSFNDTGEKDLPWTSAELDGAINDYVANNKDVDKASMLKSVKLRENLKEFSSFASDGKNISAKKALELAMRGFTLEPLKKGSKKSLGGGGRGVKQNASTKSSQVTNSMSNIMELAGIDPKEFAESEAKRKK